MENLHYSFMAIAKGVQSTESAEFKKYIGVAPVYVLSVNPTKDEMESILDTSLEKDPEYVTTMEVDGKEVPNARITFLTKPDATKVGFEAPVMNVTMFLRKEYRYNKDKTKVQIIDKYGRTAWVTIEQAKNREIPVYSNGPANIDKDYRPAYIGEEELTNFIKCYLNIPNVMKYVNNTWELVKNPEECECRLEDIEKYFNGDFSELKGAIALQPNNKIKVMFGVRTNNEGKEYQTAYTNMFLRNSSRDNSALEKDLKARKEAGSYSTTEFSTKEFKEYVVEATNFNSDDNDLPFAPETTNPWGI